MPNSPKANDNSNTSGVLRYALHLRFLCPLSKKNSKMIQRCKSDPFAVSEKDNKPIGGDRRFYLYNDMRVVFPQRHSDSDEGKVCLDIILSPVITLSNLFLYVLPLPVSKQGSYHKNIHSTRIYDALKVTKKEKEALAYV